MRFNLDNGPAVSCGSGLEGGGKEEWDTGRGRHVVALSGEKSCSVWLVWSHSWEPECMKGCSS